MIHEGDAQTFDIDAIVSEMNVVLLRDKMKWNKRTWLSLTNYKHSNALVMMFPTQKIDLEDPVVEHFKKIVEMSKKDKNMGLIIPVVTSYESWEETLVVLPEPGVTLGIDESELPMIYAVRAGIEGEQPILTRKFHYPMLGIELEKP